MKKIILLIALFAVVGGILTAGAQVNKETLLFAEKPDGSLWLDRYYQGGAEPSPCVIFMFGGAFARGTRDRADYIPYFEHLVGRGYTVVSIDYRLGLKNIAEVEGLNDEVAARMLIGSIEMAVDDLLDATKFVLDRAYEWNIDPGTVVLNGSSAGAVTVLQAEYELCNGMHAGRLPVDFKYAGVISFAGAILTLNGTFNYGRTPAPTMLMHGDYDRQVPYNVLTLGHIGFYGSKYISDGLVDLGVPHSFYSFADYGHEIASVPIREFWEEVDSFLLHAIRRQEPLTVLQQVTNSAMPVQENKNFTISDYLNGNYGL